MMKDYRKDFKYNIICRLFFCWVDPLFWVGCCRSLAHSDLYPHPFECDSLYLHEKFKGYWSNELSTRGSANVRLWWVILKCFWWRSLLIQFLALLLVAVFMAQSETLGLLTDYFSLETPTPEDTNNVYIYAALLILMSAFLILLNLVFYVGRKFGGMVRILLTNAIYFKVLSLSQCTLSHVTMGHVINIASNDVHRFDECILYFPFFLVFPIHLFVVLYLLYLKVQWSSVIIVGVILVSLPVLISLSVIYSIFRFKAAKVTDRRVKVMNEIISGIRVIKMYGWEYAFSQLVCKIRREEVWDVFKGIIVKQLSVAYATRIHNLLIYVLLSVFLLTGGDLTPGIVYSVFAHTIFLRFTFSHFSQALLYLLESRVGYKRIKGFLLLPELEAFRNQHEEYCDFLLTVPLNTNVDTIGITVENLTASWSMSLDDTTLQDISFNIDQSKPLLAVVGAVGSGKSTLLQCLLKELPVLSGTLSVRGSVAYASQEACVFSTSLRENILFGLPYEEEWYRTVVHACALEKDISLLENGDMTLVGERGVTLSGGQKARYTFKIGGYFLIAIIANYYLIVLLVILCTGFVGVRWYYIKTARDIKRLEAIARSPIYSHLSMTLQGLSTIRSYSMQSVMIERMHQYQNQHTQAWYLFIVTSRWFSMRLDCFIFIFIATILFSSISLAESFNSALISLSLTYAITLMDLFAYYMRASTEVENLMVSPERVIAYGGLEVEASLETLPPFSKPPPNWPDKGNIVLNDLCYSHSVDGPQVLTNISCAVSNRSKVGIVGRTGAGKTSLVSALFRLAEPTGGNIVIDGIDVNTLGLHDLRKNISIIPQDPVLFGGSIRYNLDPFQVYNDNDIWRALEQVQLKSVVEELDDGLLSVVTEGGSNFSVGQRQLFCLARALLRNNTILVLDEATANVDMKTDRIIQEVICKQFNECTVLTIAHRLNTVMDCDKIMVLDKGELVEYDEPYLLLCESSSYLGQLVDQTGPVNAKKLRDIALVCHQKNK
ncbi:PREDICTED: multidrug resistance-associated protein 4-like [Amphimedon queenslandica]|uniref:Uncharacterized protein n=1 Tax=Amphimedon queenslandica TaxID=400682 RepID=A0AAN0J2R8_AMPQE|nr:PREDICTED: multidrug resistance-associated protein 4-like [Amphimedon queenslandica]|eukprot:XP_019851290.1 PREDICTED: multidrug resistance-associated protein 4-like [Amphimedon queenslandica]